MKVLHVFDFFSMRRGGGTLDVLYKLAKAQTQKGHEVTVYTSDFELEPDYIESLTGVKVYPFHIWLSLFGFIFMPGMIGEVRRKLKDFDIVHLHCFRSFQNILIHHYAKRYGIPYVMDTRGSLPKTHGAKSSKWLLKWLFDLAFGYRILRDARRLIAETEVGVNEYKEFGVSQDKIALISPPFPVEEFSQPPPRGQFRNKFNVKEKYIIMFLGRIHWIKGLDFLVESFYELTQSRKDVILAIVGADDGHKPSLERLINGLNLSDKVLFTGFLGGEEKLAALVDADIFVQTSRYEQGAWAPFEAVLCNTPIIVSNNSGAGEDVRKADAGYLVEYGDKNGLRDMILYILNHPDEARIKTRKAKAYIEANLSMTKGIEKYEKLYKEVVEEA